MAPRAGGRGARGRLAAAGAGAAAADEAPSLGVREAAAPAAEYRGGGGGRPAPCWSISQDAPPPPSVPRPRPASPRRPALAARGPGWAGGEASSAACCPEARGAFAVAEARPAGPAGSETRTGSRHAGPAASRRCPPPVSWSRPSAPAAPRVGRGRAACGGGASSGDRRGVLRAGSLWTLCLDFRT